ncbi:putative hemolysin-III channel protein Izh2 [Gigaspora margarita]|uniref:Putative hemolysin-III channel protein Izh2 n=1 Tax=Gigaspora margarita TaxID=4874 RepID=A0A8H3WY85_GIGMA|nr:putative hemolysin-III channel protein Izh2 [Gigaspora margarita]
MSLTQRKFSPNLINENKTILRNDVDYKNTNSDIKKKSLTCNFDELPHWLQDNVDILTCYRRPTYSYIKCFQSLFYIHNESVNIWSHLIGALIFIIISITTYFFLSAYPTITIWDFIVQYSFLAGVLMCLTFSTLFHSFMCHSEMVCANWNRCDYCGIVFLSIGSMIPIAYYVFYCNKTLRIIYIALVCILGSATISVAIPIRFRTPEFRLFRTTLFIALGGSVFIPIIHAIVIYGLNICYNIIAFKWMLSTLLIYFVGAIIYGARVPEKLYPGSFDILGSSHQIFHMFVVLGCLCNYYGLISAMSYWHKNNSDCQIDIELLK